MQRANLLLQILGFAAAGAVFAVMFWLVDAGAVFTAMAGADPLLLAAVAGTILLWNLSWGVALWHVLRAQQIQIPFYLAALVNAAGAFANHVTPLGQAGGEPVTAWLLTQTVETDYEVSLASIASLDAINVVPSLGLATAGAVYFLTIGSGVETLGLLPIAILAVAALVPILALLAWRFRRRIAHAVGAVARPIAGVVPRLSPESVDALGDRASGFAGAVRRVAVSRRRLAAALSFSALGWAFQAVGLWVTFLALDSFIPLYVPFFVLPIGKAGSVLPTPGGLGGAEAINVTLLTLLTGPSAATIAAAVTIHSVGGYLLTTGVGAAATSVLGVHQ